MTDAPWWERAFGPDYPALYAHRDDQAAGDEVAGIVPRLREATTATGLPILDVGCGGGRHLDALRRAGLPAFGFDLSPHLLAQAQARPALAGGLVRADMRLPPLADGSCAAVVLLFTAFGYFDDAANAACFAALARLVAPGGWLLLDLPDPDHVRRTLVPRSERTLPDGRQVIEERRLVGNRVEKTVTISGVEPYVESVRLYRRTDIARLCAVTPHTVDEVWSSLCGISVNFGRQVLWIRVGSRSPILE
jgi:SAM-dependent methyltransferase